MTLAELIAELAKLDPKDVATELQKGAQPAWQAVFDRGHSTATAALQPKITETGQQLTAAQTKVTELEGQVASLRQTNPDVAKIHEQYQGQIRTLTEQHNAKMAEVTGSVTNERKGRAIADLKAKLVTLGVDPDYADVQTQKLDVVKRIKINEAGAVEVMQDGKDIPLVPAEGRQALDLLAAEIKGKVPAKMIVSTVDRGSGVEGDRAAAGSKSYYDGIRERTKAAETARVAPPPNELEKRLGMTPATK